MRYVCMEVGHAVQVSGVTTKQLEKSSLSSNVGLFKEMLSDYDALFTSFRELCVLYILYKGLQRSRVVL